MIAHLLKKQNNTRYLLVSLLSLVLLGLLFIPQLGLAADPSLGKVEKADVSVIMRMGQYMGNLILYIASYITWAGGMLLQLSIGSLVIGMGSLLAPGSALGGTIETLWVLIRDIANLAFIFGFIYIGIKLIIDADDSFAKRQLAQLLIGALLINFSLFFTRIVIDFGNLTAVEINKAMTTGGGDISTAIAGTLGVSTFYQAINPETFAGWSVSGNIAFYVMGAVLLIIAGFILAAGAFMLIIRFVALIFLMIFSPILFAAIVFPQTAGYAKKLWGLLFSYSFYAPVFLLLIFISIKVLQVGFGATISGGGSLSDALSSGKQDAFSVVLNFVIAIMFLILSLKLANQMSMVGGGAVVKVGNNLRGKVQSTIGKNTVGRASGYALKKYEKFDAQTKDSKVWSKLKTVGVDRSIRGTLESGKKAKFGGSYSYKDDQDYAKERKLKQASTLELDSFKKTIDAGRAATAGRDEKIAMERAVAGASAKFLEELSDEQRKGIVDYMTQGQIDGLMNGDKLSEIQKKELSNARTEIVKSIYENARDNLSKASSEHLVALGSDYLKEDKNAIRLSSSQMDDLKKKLTRTEYEELERSRNGALLSLATGNQIDGKDKNHILSKKPAEIAKMPPDVLKQLSAELSIATLSKISQDGTLSKQDQADIRNNIERAIRNAPPNAANTGQLVDYDDWLKDSPLGKQFGR